MKNSITGSNSDPSITSFSTFPTESTSQTAPIKESVISSDIQIMEGADLLNREDIITQQFVPIQQWGIKDVYQASLQFPVLPTPDPEGHTGPLPFEPSWQKAANEAFKDRLREHLIKKHTPIVAKENASYNQDAGAPTSSKQEPKDTGNLNESVKDFVSLDRNQQSDGQNEPILPAPQLEIQVNKITSAVINQQSEILTPEEREIVALSTEEIQKEWQLPASWKVGSSDAKDWTPITTQVTPPINVDQARKIIIGENIEELLRAFENVGKKVGDSLPPNDPSRIAVADLIKVIAQALQILKQVMQEAQLKEADLSAQYSKAKYDSIQYRQAEIEKSQEKLKESIQIRKEQEYMAKVMKILAPVISGLIILAGLLALPFTGGGSTSLIIAGVAVASVMLTYTALDAVYDITSKAVKAFGEWLETSFPGEQNLAIKNLIKSAILMALVVVLVIAIFTSGGTAAANIASGISAQTIKQAAIEAAKQLALEFSIIAIMTSNILPDLITQAVIKLGLVDEKDEQGKMIAQIVVMALMMLSVTAVFARGNIKSMINSAREGITQIGNTMRKVGDIIMDLAQAVKEGATAAINQIKELIKELIRLITQGIASLKNMNLMNMIQDLPAGIAEGIQKAFNKTLSAAKELKDFLSSGALLETLKAGAHAVTDAAQLAASKVMDQLSILAEKFKQAAQELRNFLQELIKQIQEQARAGMDHIGEQLRNTLAKGVEFLGSLPDKFQAFKNLIPTSKQELIESLQKILGEVLPNLQTYLKMSKVGMDAGVNFYLGALGIHLARIYEELGELEKTQEIIQLMIKLFEKLLHSFQEDMGANSEWLKNITQAIDSTYASGYRVLNKASQNFAA